MEAAAETAETKSLGSPRRRQDHHEATEMDGTAMEAHAATAKPQTGNRPDAPCLSEEIPKHA